jgi:SAM-dependent methyltransferase
MRDERANPDAGPSPAEVDEFLRTTAFTGYHSVPLPRGRRTPGRDASATADAVLGDRVRGKTVLDVGTYYGFYALEAMRRGARAALGIEPRPARCAIARRIAELHGGRYEIRQAWAHELTPKDRFDVVLLLRVLHHVREPVAFLRVLASHCSETMVVEFRRPSHGDHLFRCVRSGPSGRGVASLAAALRVRLAQLALDRLGSRIPLASPGERGFYFTPAGFTRIFVERERIFDAVEFSPSATRSCTIAHCRVAAEAPAEQEEEELSG